jgi:uncharacterized protein (DUF433 family)
LTCPCHFKPFDRGGEVAGVEPIAFRWVGGGEVVGDRIMAIAQFEGTVMDLHDRIVLDANILVGKPVIKGTRLAVEFVIDLMAQGWTFDEILRNYPGIEAADLQACLNYASALLKAEKIYAIPA